LIHLHPFSKVHKVALYPLEQASLQVAVLASILMGLGRTLVLSPQMQIQIFGL